MFFLNRVIFPISNSSERVIFHIYDGQTCDISYIYINVHIMIIFGQECEM